MIDFKCILMYLIQGNKRTVCKLFRADNQDKYMW